MTRPLLTGKRAQSGRVLKTLSAIAVAVSGYLLLGGSPSAHATSPSAAAFSVGNETLVEGAGGVDAMDIPVTLNEPATAKVGVSYITHNGTALSGVDYMATSGSLSFAAGITEKTVEISVLPNHTAATKSFALVLSLPTGGSIIYSGVGNATIIDTGTLQTSTVSVGGGGIFSGQSGGTRAIKVPVTLATPASVKTTVSYALSNGTATSPTDYESETGKVSFAVGESVKYITVTVNPHAGPMPNLIVNLKLTESTNVVLGTTASQVILLSDNSVLNPLDPSFSGAPMTFDRNSRSKTFDTYGITTNNGRAESLAASTNSGGNSRMIFWPSPQSTLSDEQTCMTIISAQNDSSGTSQFGLVLRVAQWDGITRAITLTDNVYGYDYTLFNVHVWDTSTTYVYTQIGSFNFTQALSSNGTVVGLPWDVCAQVVGNTLSALVWLDGQPKPSWGDPVHSGSLTLPAGWDYAGNAGWYVGHLSPASGFTYANLTTGPATQ